jgi:hypothetical protein
LSWIPPTVSPTICNMRDYRQRASEIIARAQEYHRAYYEAKTFTGPSLYFHRKSLENRDPASLGRRLEYIYATLAAWGMHRMGSKGSKMLPLDTFRSSVVTLKDRISEVSRFTHAEMNEDSWRKVEAIFTGIKVMSSATTIVGNSKVMAHLIPNIVPPIDRQYTLKFLHGNTSIKNDPKKEWILMKEIVSEFFIPVALDQKFRRLARRWMDNQRQYPWDTSILKIIDNLIIGAQKTKQLTKN